MIFRSYQREIFLSKAGVHLIHWGRQLGKSTVLAAWAVDRLLTRPGRLVTVLSNCQQNGVEFSNKCQELCRDHGAIFEAESRSVELDLLASEIRIKVQGKLGRIKVLAANPRTARGFSGDLILDEFAFHQDDRAIWEAAEPILSSSRDYMCRIASTGNGRNNMFYEMASSGRYPISRISRTDAWRLGVKIFDPNTREEITPDQARAATIDKIAYDQNYELAFTGAGAQLLTADTVLRAEDPACGLVTDGPLPAKVIEDLKRSLGTLFVGIDVGRNRDLTVASVLEWLNGRYYLRAMIRLAGLPLPQQQRIIEPIFQISRVLNGNIDMTGIGLGLAEYLQEKAPGKLTGIHFAQTTAWIDHQEEIQTRITDAMAINTLMTFENEKISIPPEPTLRASLQLPERSGSLRGAIYTPRSTSGHADDFWSLALALWAARPYETPFQFSPVHLKAHNRRVSL